MKTPPCFDSDEQYIEWYIASLDPSLGSLHRPTYCTDCLPGYQKKMIAQGRCSHPGTQFVRCGGPDAFYGRRSRKGVKRGQA